MINNVLSFFKLDGLERLFVFLGEADTYLFGTFTSLVINSAILTLFFVGCGIILLQFLKIRWNRKALAAVQLLFENAEKTEPDQLLDQLEHKGISKKTLVMKAIGYVRTVKMRDGNIDLVSDSLRTIAAPRLSWGGYIAGILILLGLIGTIVGLSQAVMNLKSILLGMGDNVTRDSFQMIIRDIMGSLSFMETAFSSTLCGFVSFLVLSFFDHGFQRSQGRFLQQIEKFYSNFLIPFFNPVQSGDSLAYIARIMKSSASELVKVTGSMTDLAASVADNQNIYTNMAKTMQDTIREISDSQNRMGDDFKALAESTQAITDLSRGFLTVYESSIKSTSQLFDKLGDDKGHIQDLYLNLDKSIHKLDTSFRDGLVEVSGNIIVAADRQAKEIRRIEMDHDLVMRASDAKANRLADTADQVIQEQKKAVEEVISGLSGQYLALAQTLADNQSRAVQSLENGMAQIKEGLENHAEELENRTMDRYENIAGEIDSRLNNLFPGLEKFLSDLYRQQADLVDSGKDVISQMKETIEQLSEQGKSIDLSEIKASLDRLGQAQRAVIDRQRAMKTRPLFGQTSATEGGVRKVLRSLRQGVLGWFGKKDSAAEKNAILNTENKTDK